MLYGKTIFPADVCAVLKEWNKVQGSNSKEDLTILKPHIIFAEFLTPEVASYTLKHPVCGIITSYSSFATHGANMLRWFLNTSSRSISWVTGITYDDILPYLEKNIIVKCDGRIEVATTVGFFCRGGNDVTRVELFPHGFNYTPLPKRSIINYNISQNRFAICYWPHRKYDYLSFSLMRKGLLRNLKDLGYNSSSAFLDRDGLIWFLSAPLVADMLRMAEDISIASVNVDNQIALYSKICNRLSSKVSLKDLAFMIEDYFSCFLLFHDTYESILVNAYGLIRLYFDEPLAYQTMNLLMSCRADKWMAEQNVAIKKRKALLSDDPVLDLPTITIISDVEFCTARLEEYIVAHNAIFWKNERKKLLFYIKFFIAKEWKFIINKLLFTRFSNTIYSQFSELEILDIQRYDIDSLIEVWNNKEHK